MLKRKSESFVTIWSNNSFFTSLIVGPAFQFKHIQNRKSFENVTGGEKFRRSRFANQKLEWEETSSIGQN